MAEYVLRRYIYLIQRDAFLSVRDSIYLIELLNCLIGLFLATGQPTITFSLAPYSFSSTPMAVHSSPKESKHFVLSQVLKRNDPLSSKADWAPSRLRCTTPRVYNFFWS